VNKVAPDFGTVPFAATTKPFSQGSTTPQENQIEKESKSDSLDDTTMHWMSPSTRRDQYRKFDKQNTGLRGLVRRILPRCVSGPPSLQFYEKDKEDVGSVRRYRMDVENHEEHEEERQKECALREQRKKLERASHTMRASEERKWGCF
jgi:hypothetical protein